MLTTTIKRFQTLPDFAAQFAGSTDAVLSIALTNGYSITDDVLPGTKLFYDEVNNIVPAYFRKKYFDVITGDNTITIDAPEGIGFWAINDDNIVS